MLSAPHRGVDAEGFEPGKLSSHTHTRARAYIHTSNAKRKLCILSVISRAYDLMYLLLFLSLSHILFFPLISSAGLLSAVT